MSNPTGATIFTGESTEDGKIKCDPDIGPSDDDESSDDGQISRVEKYFIPDSDTEPSDDEYEQDSSSDSVSRKLLQYVAVNLQSYKMDHPNRGHALIFNHETYSGTLKMQPREGTEKDKERLTNTLEKLGFKVHVFFDFCVQEIKSRLKHYSDMDHTDNDCILIAVLTHGKKDGILYAYDTVYNIETLWEQFTPETCPSLAQKPKIIILQSCRGNETNEGVNLNHPSSHEIDCQRLNSEMDTIRIEYSIPGNADIILAAATADGFVAYRSKSEGSIFIKLLCEELLDDPENRELLNVLTSTNRRVAVEFESINLKNPAYDKKKQVSCIISMLTRELYFKPKPQGSMTRRPRSIKRPKKIKC